MVVIGGGYNEFTGFPVVNQKTTGFLGEDHVWFEDRWMVASLCDE
jgi:hypothetical protein